MKAVKKFFKTLWEFIKSFNTPKGYIALIISWLLLYGWVVALFVIGTVTKEGYLIGLSTTVALFWAGPFTPFLLTLVALTKFIQKVILRDKRIPKHKERKV